MIVFLNGAFLSEENAVVSVFDRGFLYGDGLFETIRLYQGQPFRWDQHLERLRHGAEFLEIHWPYSPDDLRAAVDQLVQRNGIADAILRIVLSRGPGQRGYSTQGADRPVLAMSLHPAPRIDPEHPIQWRLVTSSLRIPVDSPLTRYKTCQKLGQVLARAEAEAKGADEALLLNTRGEVAEAASGNLFWIHHRTVCTAPLASGALPGVTRSVIFEICPKLAVACREEQIDVRSLLQSDGVFVTLSTLEVVEVVGLEGRALALSPITDQIRRAYRALASGGSL